MPSDRALYNTVVGLKIKYIKNKNYISSKVPFLLRSFDSCHPASDSIIVHYLGRRYSVGRVISPCQNTCRTKIKLISPLNFFSMSFPVPILPKCTNLYGDKLFLEKG